MTFFKQRNTQQVFVVIGLITAVAEMCQYAHYGFLAHWNISLEKLNFQL